MFSRYHLWVVRHTILSLFRFFYALQKPKPTNHHHERHQILRKYSRNSHFRFKLLKRVWLVIFPISIFSHVIKLVFLSLFSDTGCFKIYSFHYFMNQKCALLFERFVARRRCISNRFSNSMVKWENTFPNSFQQENLNLEEDFFKINNM